MSNILYRYNEFIVIKSERGYIVININGKYKHHSHFSKSIQACKDCIKFVSKKKVPRYSLYMLEACRRLSLDEDYINEVAGLIEIKKNKGIRRYIRR